MEIVIIVIAFALIVLFYYQSSLRAKKKEAFRQSNYEKVNALLPEIENHVISFKQFAQFDSGYFNHLKLKIWKNGSKKTYAAITNLPYNSIELPFQKLELIETFVNYYSNGGVVRKSYNGRFVKHELTIYKRFFDNIDGQKLDTQQRTAIVTDEDNNIVVAGAGSGKTTTVVGKVSYIVERYKIKPEEILLISFTRNAAEEMNKRIKKKMKIDIDTMTFHKLGLDIIASATDEKPSVFEEKKLTGLIEGFISAEKKDLNYLSKMNNFFINFLKPYKSESEFKNHGDYIQYIKDTNFKSYKQLSYNIKGRQTLLREPCKSMEEVIIANFLYLNNINYEYEKVYQYNTATKNHAQYKPDFYLPDFDIYIEHFGIDRNGNVPKWFDDNHYEDANEKYKLGIKWKRETHKKYKTTLIETFSYEKTEGELLLNLEKKLKLNRVVVKPKSSTEVAEIISKVAPEEINNFNQLVITFLTLLKSNNYSIADIKKKNNFSKGGLEKQRNEAFLELFIPLFNKYQNHLSSEKEIDFSDMINHATEYISSQQVSRPYKVHNY
jgi:DNA helicase-4